MANQVYANNMEVSCKKADGKSICAFPDVCMTPPQTPATPPGVPIPYPNTGMASDTSDGSSSVKVSGAEVMLKNKSYFKKSTGDEAGSAPMKGVVTHKNTGKIYFTKWSMDVMVEGENVVRHLDLTTHNHASQPGQTMPWTYLERMAAGLRTGKCNKEKHNVEDACGKPLDRKAKCNSDGKALSKALQDRNEISALVKAGKAPKSSLVAARKVVRNEHRNLAIQMHQDKCQRALRCFLPPYEGPDGKNMCCPGQTPDHLIEASSFLKPAQFSGQARNARPRVDGWDKYDVNAAPCICAEGGATNATHGLLSARRKVRIPSGSSWTIEQAAQVGASAAHSVFKGCSPECIKAQLLEYHQKAQTKPNAHLKATSYGSGDPAVLKSAKAVMKLILS